MKRNKISQTLYSEVDQTTETNYDDIFCGDPIIDEESTEIEPNLDNTVINKLNMLCYKLDNISVKNAVLDIIKHIRGNKC